MSGVLQKRSSHGGIPQQRVPRPAGRWERASGAQQAPVTYVQDVPRHLCISGFHLFVFHQKVQNPRLEDVDSGDSQPPLLILQPERGEAGVSSEDREA